MERRFTLGRAGRELKRHAPAPDRSGMARARFGENLAFPEGTAMLADEDAFEIKAAVARHHKCAVDPPRRAIELKDGFRRADGQRDMIAAPFADRIDGTRGATGRKQDGRQPHDGSDHEAPAQ
jgi:hypothetical protein